MTNIIFLPAARLFFYLFIYLLIFFKKHFFLILGLRRTSLSHVSRDNENQHCQRDTR